MIHDWHSSKILHGIRKELKSHDWFHAFADDHRTLKNGSAHMEEIRNAIGWINKNGDNDDRKDAKRFWEESAPAQFKKNFPKNLKKYTRVPDFITQILKKKPKDELDPDEMW